MTTPIVSRLFNALDDKAPFSSGAQSPNSSERSIDFVAGIPDFSLLPRDDYARAATELMSSDDAVDALRYSSYRGVSALRNDVARLRNVDLDNVFITNGATQGIYLSVSALLDPGDTILVENPTFPFALKTFRLLGLNVQTVPLLSDGVDLDALESILQSGKRFKAFYTIPEFQNPTGISTTADKKRRLLELAERYNFVVIADSPYRELWLDHEPAEFPQEQRVVKTDGKLIEIGTFSKTLGPGWRVGWIITDSQRVNQLTSFRRRVDAHPSGVAQYTIAKLLERPEDWYQHLVEHERNVYEAKSSALFSVLHEELNGVVELRKPEGGYFQWVVFDPDHDPASVKRVRELERLNVHLVPGDVFFTYDHGSHAARLAFSHLPTEDLVEGAHRLAEALK